MAEQSEVKIELSYGKITVDSVITGHYQKKGTLTAQLRQIIEVTSTYPSQRISSSLSDNLFEEEDFEESEGAVYKNKETRITWLTVPVGQTKESIEKLIKKNKDACIYKIMSNRPILDEGQQMSITKGLKTMDDYAGKQISRYGDAADNPNALIFDKNEKIFYRRCFFSLTARPDVDLRTADKEDVYMSQEVEEEIEAMADQFLK